jgi:hypothetical protein
VTGADREEPAVADQDGANQRGALVDGWSAGVYVVTSSPTPSAASAVRVLTVLTVFVGPALILFTK